MLLWKYMSNKHLTMYLFSQPSFIEGMARTLDLGDTFDTYNESRDGREADYTALRNDWIMIGEDIKSAIQQYGKE